MFSTGQRVVCINDDFEPWVFDLYRSLPKKDKVYTIRAVSAGRSNPTFALNDDAQIEMTGAEFDIRVLLKELNNGLHIGPILMGTAQPAHILAPTVTSRGIVNMAAIAATEAAG